MSGFVFVSGRPCLDFVGTLLWRRTLSTELLTAPEELDRWCTEAGLASEPTAPSAADLGTAVALREALYAILHQRVTGSAERLPRAAVELVNAHAGGPLPVLSLHRDGTASSRASTASVLALLARDAITLAGSAELARVKECANTDCTRMFVDISRGSSRRWCGMAECGNRIKAADYRRRRRDRAAPVSAG